MLVYFSGIGGTAIGPLALIAKKAGYEVAGSDSQTSAYIDYLKKHGIEQIEIDQTADQIKKFHEKHPIDWLVHSSAIAADHPELVFARRNGIKTSKRDELINRILSDKNLKMLAIAGTHGKTTTTAMVVWLFKQLGQPISYSLGAKIPFGEMGEFDDKSGLFVYECDEFDRNFLAFKPFVSVITGVTWDHHEIYHTREEYKQAFRDFITQSRQTFIWEREDEYLELPANPNVLVLSHQDAVFELIKLPGLYNREDALIAARAVQQITGEPLEKLIEIINRFPGLSRRMELIVHGLYSDYAHTPEKIRGAIATAKEMANGKRLYVVYEPLTNRRQHYMIGDYGDCFNGATHVYWIPSYLAREDPNQRVIPPSEMIARLFDPSIAEPRERDENLKQTIQQHLDRGDMVVCLAGGGGGSLDDWIREEFK